MLLLSTENRVLHGLQVLVKIQSARTVKHDLEHSPPNRVEAQPSGDQSECRDSDPRSIRHMQER